MNINNGSKRKAGHHRHLREEKKRLLYVKRMPEERIPKLIMEWIPRKGRKRGCPRKMWMEGVQAAMTTRNLEPEQWRNREEWRLVSGRWRQLLKTGQIDRKFTCVVTNYNKFY